MIYGDKGFAKCPTQIVMKKAKIDMYSLNGLYNMKQGEGGDEGEGTCCLNSTSGTSTRKAKTKAINNIRKVMVSMNCCNSSSGSRSRRSNILADTLVVLLLINTSIYTCTCHSP